MTPILDGTVWPLIAPNALWLDTKTNITPRSVGCSASQGRKKSKIGPKQAQISTSAANRMIFSTTKLKSAWNGDLCTYQVCPVTPSSRGDILGASQSFFMKNQWKSMILYGSRRGRISKCLQNVVFCKIYLEKLSKYFSLIPFSKQRYMHVL